MADTSVDWELARQVATKIGDRNSAVSSYHYATLSPDFERFTAQAEELVAETTGLVSQMGNARGRVADRPMWIDANICLLYTSPSPRDQRGSRMPSSA